MSSFRFSVQGGPFGDPDALREHARRVEFLGYRELFTADHIGNGAGDPMVPLVVAAESTTTLRVGPLVLNNEFHHPAMLARTVLSMDRMSNGRVVLGMGTGYAQNEHDATSITLRAPRERVDRFAESLRVLRDLLDTGSCSFHGDHHDIEIESLGVDSVQPRIPFLIGGHGKRVVSLAGEFADVFQFTGLTTDASGALGTGGFGLESLDQRAEWLSEAQDDRSIERSALVQVCKIGTDGPSNEELAERFGTEPSIAAETPFALVGSVEQVVDKIERLRDRLGITHYVVRDADNFAPIVDALS